MLKNYLKIAYRNLIKSKIFSLINILGLAIGLTACLLIIHYVRFELSYDQFHEKADRIYRAALYQYKHGVLDTKSATIFPVTGRTLQENFPETVEAYVRLNQSSEVFSYIDGNEQKVFNEKKVFYTDASFFEVFSFPLLAGNAAHALTNPNTVVITAAAAEKYFGSAWQEMNPVGKSIQSRSYFGETDLLITGVVADPPENSHLKFDFLVSYSTMYEWDDGETNYLDESENCWCWEVFYTYVLLKPGGNPQRLEASFAPMVEQNTTNQRAPGTTYHVAFQPLEEIHLYSELMNELEVNGNAQTVYILLIIAFCILVIAWVNFVNLSVVKAIERGKEIGMRKVLGATRKQLVAQHLLETSLLNVLGIFLACTLYQLSLPFFEQVTGMSFDETSFMSVSGLLYTSLLLIVGTVLSGLYPAFALSAYQPTKVLKGNIIRSKQEGWLKKGLVVFQFATSSVFIIIIFIVGQQLSFMKSHELGVDIEQKLVIEGPKFVSSMDEYHTNIKAYKTSLKRHSAVQYVTLSRNVPATEIRGNNYVARLDKPEDQKFYHVMGVDYDYMATFDLQLLAGRFFDEDQPVSNAEIIKANENAPDFGTNDHSVIINETAAKNLGFLQVEDAIHQQISVFGGVKEIVGVVKDYHHKSLKNSFEPIIFYLQPTGWAYLTMDLQLIKNTPDKLAEVIDYAEKEWKQLYPGEPFNYFFLDDLFNQQYQTDQQFYLLFNLFTGLAIFIACLGLFGLSSYAAIQRTKEIGIRKVLGASVQNILTLLSWDFIRLVLIASLLAVPVAYLVMQKWLENYAFRIDIGWWLLLVPIAIVLLIALLTVSFQTVKAALTNPVKSLRYE